MTRTSIVVIGTDSGGRPWISKPIVSGPVSTSYTNEIVSGEETKIGIVGETTDGVGGIDTMLEESLLFTQLITYIVENGITVTKSVAALITEDEAITMDFVPESTSVLPSAAELTDFSLQDNSGYSKGVNLFILVLCSLFYYLF